MRRSRFTSYWVTGDLGLENDHFLRTFWHLSEAFSLHVVSLVHDEQRKDISGHCVEITVREDLHDNDCPVCYDPYTTSAEIAVRNTQQASQDNDAEDPADDPIPLQLPCKHIVCRPCLTLWTGSLQDNNDKCPTCRRDILPPNPQIAYRDELLAALSSLKEDNNMTPQVFAEKSLQALDTYWCRLPSSGSSSRSIFNALYSTEPIEAANLHHWLHNLSMRPEQVHMDTNSFFTANFSENPSTIARLALVQKRSDVALRCMSYARRRLRAFLNGDESGYRHASQCGMLARALFENLTMLIEMDDFLVDMPASMRRQPWSRR
jgi:hypothetical protein